MTVIYLARHGQTPLNESGVLRGLLDPSLDDVGHEQARRLAAELGPRRPSAVAASPLLRAMQTAQPVAEQSGLEVAADGRLVDRDYGQCTGQDKESVVARWGSVDAAPGAEPRSAVRSRALTALADIAQDAHDLPVVVVSHDAVIREILAALDPGLGDPDEIPQDNGYFNTLEYQDGRWAVLKINQCPRGPEPV